TDDDDQSPAAQRLQQIDVVCGRAARPGESGRGKQATECRNGDNASSRQNRHRRTPLGWLGHGGGIGRMATYRRSHAREDIVANDEVVKESSGGMARGQDRQRPCAEVVGKMKRSLQRFVPCREGRELPQEESKGTPAKDRC